MDQIFRVVDKDGDPISGYNNTGGTYKTYTGALRCIAWAERLDRRYRQGDYPHLDRRPYTVETAVLRWEKVEPCEYTQSHTREFCGNLGCRVS